jgi:arsenite-transporting ATPase
MMPARVIIFTGKGGTGKTTSAAATALLCAKKGYKTLVMSSDPAHSLSDSFNVHIGGAIKKLKDNLWGLEMDAHSEMHKEWGTTVAYAKHLLSVQYDEALAGEILALPGIDEVFTLLNIKKFINDYDVIVLDTAPTGHTLRMLSLPEAIGGAGQKLINIEKKVTKVLKPFEGMIGVPLPDAKAFDETDKLYKRLMEARNLLAGKNTTVRIVLNPEIMCIRETERAMTFMNLFGFHVDSVILNKIFPHEIKDPYFDKWKKLQKKYMKEVELSFKPLSIMTVPLMESEVVGFDLLEEVAKELYGKKDPTSIFTSEKPFEIGKRRGEFYVKIKLPFTKKKEVKMEAADDKLIINVGWYKRILVLPSVVMRRAVKKAELKDGYLTIVFESSADEKSKDKKKKKK